MTYEQRYGDCPPDGPDRERWRDRKAVWIKAQTEEREECARIAEDVRRVDCLCGTDTTGGTYCHITIAHAIRARRTP